MSHWVSISIFFMFNIEMEAKLSTIYYSLQGYGKGIAAIKKARRRRKKLPRFRK